MARVERVRSATEAPRDMEQTITSFKPKLKHLHEKKALFRIRKPKLVQQEVSMLLRVEGSFFSATAKRLLRSPLTRAKGSNEFIWPKDLM